MGLTFGTTQVIQKNLSELSQSIVVTDGTDDLIASGTYTYIDLYKWIVTPQISDAFAIKHSTDFYWRGRLLGSVPNIIDFGNTPLRIPNTSAIFLFTSQWKNTVLSTMIYDGV